MAVAKVVHTNNTTQNTTKPSDIQLILLVSLLHDYYYFIK